MTAALRIGEDVHPVATTTVVDKALAKAGAA